MGQYLHKRKRQISPASSLFFISLHSVSSQALKCNFCSFKHSHKVINHSSILSLGVFLSFSTAVSDFSLLLSHSSFLLSLLRCIFSCYYSLFLLFLTPSQHLLPLRHLLFSFFLHFIFHTLALFF